MGLLERKVFSFGDPQELSTENPEQTPRLKIPNRSGERAPTPLSSCNSARKNSLLSGKDIYCFTNSQPTPNYHPSPADAVMPMEHMLFGRSSPRGLLKTTFMTAEELA